MNADQTSGSEAPENPFRNKRLQSAWLKVTMDRGRKLFAGLACNIVTDNPAFDASGAILILGPQDFQAAFEHEGYFLLAFEQDDLCVAFMEACISAGRSVLPLHQFYPVAEYWRTNSRAKQALEQEFDLQTSREVHKWDTADFVNITQAIEATKNIQGSYVEVGVFQGNSAKVALRYMKHCGIARDSFFLDVFIGFTYPEAQTSVDQLWRGSHTVEAPEARAVVSQLQSYADAEWPVKINVLKRNIITDPLPSEAAPIAVANLDVDMYEAVYAGLDKLAPLIAPRGILIVEDPGHTPALSGARMALNHFLNSAKARDFIPIAMASGQTFLIKTGV
jgi:hypothetical protein